MFWSWIYINDSEETYTIHMSDLSGDNLETLVNTDDIPGMLCVIIIALRYILCIIQL